MAYLGAAQSDRARSAQSYTSPSLLRQFAGHFEIGKLT
jgi:hypothetical protein